jgi:hypothetical protein
MASTQQRAQCVVWFSKTKSPITVQRNYRRVFEKDPPDKMTIKAWYDKFLAAGSVLRQSGSGKNARLTKRCSMSWRPFREVRQSRFIERHLSSTSHVQQFTRCFINDFVYMLTKSKLCRFSSQMTDHNEDSSPSRCLTVLIGTPINYRM